MGLLTFVIFGLVIGAIARLLMPGHTPGGFIGTALTGMAGSVVGAHLGRVLGIYHQPNQTAGWVMSVIGALTLLLLYRLVAGRR